MRTSSPEELPSMLHVVLFLLQLLLSSCQAVSRQHPPFTICMLLEFLSGITDVKAVSLDPDLSSWCKYWFCSAVVISTIIMSSCVLLLVSAAPLCKKTLSTVRSKPLACKHLSGITNAETLLLCLIDIVYLWESFPHLQSGSDYRTAL